MVRPCSSPASEPNWQGGIKLLAMHIDRVSDAPFPTSCERILFVRLPPRGNVDVNTIGQLAR
jgi:hypothetical protein